MQSNRTCPLIEQYLGYLIVIKGRSENTIKECQTDLLMFFSYVMESRKCCPSGQRCYQYSW